MFVVGGLVAFQSRRTMLACGGVMPSATASGWRTRK
jgi:hypothetical protein